MKLERIELREVTARLKFRFETSFGVEQDLRKVLLTLHTEGVEGYGEATGGLEPGYSYETNETVWNMLSQHIIPHVSR